MTGLEVALLVIGLIVIVASFIFSSKADENVTVTAKNVDFTEKQKEEIKKQIDSILDDQIEEVKEKTEVALDKLSNEKMLEMNEYSDTILSEINRNHNEVMFLYDMLNEKKKEINITVRDMNIVKKEIQSSVQAPEVKEEIKPKPQPKPKKNITKTVPVIPADIDDDAGFMASEAKLKNETRDKKSAILHQLDAVDEAVSDDILADEEAVPAKKSKKKATGKTAAKRLKEQVSKESLRSEQRKAPTSEGNNNERILELNSKGMTNVEIAKELGIGIGEVKLVIDLFRGGK